MTALTAIIEDLKKLPPDKREEAATFIHSLRVAGEAEREVVFDEIFGWMSPEEADQFEQTCQ